MKMVVMYLCRRPERHPRRILIRATGTALVAALGLGLAGCASSASRADSGQPGKPRVLASFYPLEFLAARVGGADVTVGNLTKPGVEPHDLELTLNQAQELGRADVLLFLKGFQPAVDEAAAQNPPRVTVDAATVVPLTRAAPDRHGTEAANADEEAHHDDAGDHEEAVGDPHLWLDPTRYATLASAVGEGLAKADPAHAAGFRARAATLAGELAVLDRDYRAGLARCQRREIVTSHAAFGYLAQRYGLTQVPISGLDPDQEPSPARLAEVRDTVRTSGATTIFFETLVSPKTARTLAADLKVAAQPLDPVEGITQPGQDYLTVMRANLTRLRAALGCT
jgi:zinc transport system substrate-binding protein